MVEPEMQSALEERVLRPVLIGRLEIEDDPVRAWTGPGLFQPQGTGDDALDGVTFDPISPPQSISEVQEDQGIGGPVTITMDAHDLDQAVLRQLVRDRRLYKGRPAWLWLGLLDEQQEAVVPDPVRLKTGVITEITTSRQQDQAVAEIEIDEDLGQASGRRTRLTDHRQFWPSDTFSLFVISLLNSRQGIRGSKGGGSATGGHEEELPRLPREGPGKPRIPGRGRR
ncbi:MAG: hypothetical protein ACOC5E_01960 [Acidobacteriota bacterium]